MQKAVYFNHQQDCHIGFIWSERLGLEVLSGPIYSMRESGRNMPTVFSFHLSNIISFNFPVFLFQFLKKYE